MTAVVDRKTGNSGVRIEAGAFTSLRNQLQGELLFDGQPGYDESRSIWNGMIDRRPAAIAMCETSADVSAAVRFAAQHDIPLSIRGCGHNIAGTAVVDKGLMIDLTRINHVNIDSETGRVNIGPGCNWARVDAATEPYGLVVPGGIVSTTGVAGFTVGGGFGWLTRKHGFTSDSLLRATVVTADGEIREANPESEPDLFWAIRGGGGNFGIVTDFEFEAQRLGPEVAAGLMLWTIDTAPRVMDHYRSLTASAPPELMYVLFMRNAPAAPFLPEEIHGKPVVGIAACYAGTAEAGLAAMEPLKSFGGHLVDTIKPKPFKEHQGFLDAGQPYGRRYYWKSVYLPEFSQTAQETLLERATSFTSPFSSVLVPHLDGIPEPSDGQPSAVSYRNAAYLVNYQASWENPAEDETHIGWARGNFDAMRPNAIGQYVNFMTEDEVNDASRAAYEPATLRRLQQVKSQYDPGNLFRLNKNIAPA